MAVRVVLNNGQQVISRMDLDEVLEAFEKALDHKTVLKVNQGDGSTLSVNPMQIVTFQEVDDATAENLVNGAASEHRDEVPA